MRDQMSASSGAVAFWRTMWKIGLTGLFVGTLVALFIGIPVAVFGLFEGLVYGTFMIFWIGLAFAGAGFIIWFISTVAAARIARMQVKAALESRSKRTPK